jgi:two-component system sensor histidine kinase ChiS
VNHLAHKNYHISEVSGGKEALEMIKNQGPYDLVLLDIMMPKISGYEVCEVIRKSWAVNDLPVIFFNREKPGG